MCTILCQLNDVLSLLLLLQAEDVQAAALSAVFFSCGTCHQAVRLVLSTPLFPFPSEGCCLLTWIPPVPIGLALQRRLQSYFSVLSVPCP